MLIELLFRVIILLLDISFAWGNVHLILETVVKVVIPVDRTILF